MGVAIAVASLAAGSASAAEALHTSTVKQIAPKADGTFLMSFYTDSAECSSKNDPQHFTVAVGQNGVDAEGSKKLYSAAMMALSLGKQVQVFFADETDDCYVNRMVLVD